MEATRVIQKISHNCWAMTGKVICSWLVWVVWSLLGKEIRVRNIDSFLSSNVESTR
jgi:hypothetical protein